DVAGAQGARGGRLDPRSAPLRQRAGRGDLGDRHEPARGPRPLYRRRRRGAAGRGGLGRTARAARRRAGAGGDTGRERCRSPIQGPGRAQTGGGAVRRGRSPELIVGLDVGTTTVCAIVAAPRPRGAPAGAGGRAINISQDREILHVLPQTFMVDDADGVREPLGMSGVRLEVEVHVVTAAVTSVQNVIRSVNRAGLTVHDVVLEPIASAEAVLYPDEKELGVVVIDIGGGHTDLALLRDG